ncbi:hypothetical protein ABPG75_003528 [Micractinium tetrahymenae]
MAAAGKQAGGGGGPRTRRVCSEKVDFLLPDGVTLRAVNVTERHFDNFLSDLEAYGIETADGRCSRQLSDVPADGVARVVLRPQPGGGTPEFSSIRGMELEALLHALARKENPGATIILLQTTPFKGDDGADYLQLDVAIVAGHTLYAGEMEDVLGRGSVTEAKFAMEKIRDAFKGGYSADLAATLQGVTQAKMFLGGRSVQSGVTVQEMADLAAAAGMSIVLPSGQGLGIAGGAATAVQL